MLVDVGKGSSSMSSSETIVSSRWAKDDDINRMIRLECTLYCVNYPGNIRVYSNCSTCASEVLCSLVITMSTVCLLIL